MVLKQVFIGLDFLPISYKEGSFLSRPTSASPSD